MFEERSPRSRVIFETILEVANRELRDRDAGERDVLRRIGAGLQRAAEAAQLQTVSRPTRMTTAGTTLGQRPSRGGFAVPQTLGQGSPQMTRVQSAPYEGQHFMHQSSQIAASFQGTHTTTAQWSLPFQGPTAQATVPGPLVMPAAQTHSQNPQQQPWHEWSESWSQFSSNLGMVSSFGQELAE